MEVKGAAVARAFAAPLLDFRRSKGFDRLLLQRIYLRGEDKDVGLLYGVPRTVRWAPGRGCHSVLERQLSEFEGRGCAPLIELSRCASLRGSSLAD